MWNNGNGLLSSRQLLYFFPLLLITIATIWIYFDMEKTFARVSEEFIRNQTGMVREFSRNIEKRLGQIVPENPVEKLAENPELGRKIDDILALFSTRHFRYVYILYLDDDGRLRYLADGSHELEERGVFGQKFDPDTEIWKEALKKRRAIHAFQQDFTGLWLTYYYPLRIWKTPRFLLIYDISIKTYENFEHILEPIRKLFQIVSIVLLSLLLLSLLWFVLYHLQRRKNCIDPLTHLYNLNHFSDIKYTLDLHDTSIVLADVDHFQRINDRYGHEVGDLVLQHVARTLQMATEIGDTIIRFGGEEFLIFIHNETDREKIKKRVFHIHNEISKTPMKLHDETIPITISLGVVPAPGNTMDMEKAIQYADKMLYLAKTGGRNRVIVFGESEANSHPLLYREVVDAVRKGSLLFYYQPIMESESGKIVKYEMLARLKDEEGNIHGPGDFIPLIQGTGAYRELTKRLLSRAFDDIREHDIGISINFDINDFFDETLFEMLHDVLERNADFANRLTIELLEENPVEQMEEIVEKIRRLKRLDIQIAIDDFGKGYAGLNYILNFQPDIIKFDRELIANLTSHSDVPVILEFIVTACRNIGIQTVAEGIENETLLEWTKRLGFDYLQGYHIGRPSRSIRGEDTEPDEKRRA
ncbi:EAL domain-containing protein [Hydrogenimonas sp.]